MNENALTDGAESGVAVNEPDAGSDRILSIETERDGDTAVVTVAGELDMSSAPRLESTLSELAGDAEVRRVVIDLSGTGFVDSSGLRAILSAHRQLDASGSELTLRAPSAPVTRLLEITALVDHFVIEG